MPYSGINDPDLPERIQKMPEKKRRAFVGAFNSTMGRCKDDPKDCEQRAFAIAQAAANEAGEKDYDSIQLEPEQVNYNPTGLSGNQACAACRWFIAPMACHLVEGVISPTGNCDLFLSPDMEMTETVIEADATQKAQHKDKNFTGYDLPASFELTGISGFKMLAEDVLPGTDWIAWFTNAYQDRDGEFFSEAALEQAAKDFQSGQQPLPPLWFWHMGEKTQHGHTTWVVKAGRFLVAGGVFEDSPTAKAFKQFYEQHPMQLSHGFTYTPADFVEGVYQAFKTFEISTIPKAAGKAANPYTAFSEGENLMQGIPFNEQQAAYLKQILGDAAQPILEAGEKVSQSLDTAGVAYKGDTEPTLTLSQVKELLLMQKADDFARRVDEMEKRVAKMEAMLSEEKMGAMIKKAMDGYTKPEKPEKEDEKALPESATQIAAEYWNNQQKAVDSRDPITGMLVRGGFSKMLGGE